MLEYSDPPSWVTVILQMLQSMTFGKVNHHDSNITPYTIHVLYLSPYTTSHKPTHNDHPLAFNFIYPILLDSRWRQANKYNSSGLSSYSMLKFGISPSLKLGLFFVVS